MSSGEIFNTDEPEPWPSAEDEEIPDCCDFCGGDLEEDGCVTFCKDCGACLCGIGCFQGHIEEEHGL